MCASCNSTGVTLREERLVGLAHIYELHCEGCNDTSSYLKRKKWEKISDSTLNSTIYQTEYNIFIAPLVRQVAIKRERSFMNYAINVQFLLAAFYIGQSGNSLDFLMGSLDLPNAQTMHQHYYRNSEEVARTIIRVAQKMMQEAIEQEIISLPTFPREAIDQDSINDVHRLPIDLFRNKLMENFDILFKQNKIRWPRSSVKRQV